MQQLIVKWLLSAGVQTALVAILSLLVVYLITYAIRRIITRYVADTATRYRARKVASGFGFFTALVVLGAVLTGHLGQLTVIIGLAGAGVAFALQEVLASVAGWAAIAFSGFYHPGDRVQLGGIRGDVIDIGILRTTLMECGDWVNADLYNGRIVRVANSFVFKEAVFNYSADFPFLWDEITVPVRYGSDWEHARHVLTEVVEEVCRDYAEQSKESWGRAVRKYQLNEISIDPLVTLAATDNWIAFTVRYIVDYRQRRVVRDRLFTRILQEVDRSAGRVRLASATFEVTNIPGLEVDLPSGKIRVQSHYEP